MKLFVRRLEERLFAQDVGLADESMVSESEVWNLGDLFSSPAEWDGAKAALEQRIPGLAEFEGTLGRDGRRLKDVLDLLHDLYREYLRLRAYASLKSDEDTRSAVDLERKQGIEFVGTKLNRASSFVRPEIIALGAESLEKLRASEPGLRTYAFFLENLIREAPHTLGAEAEGVLSSSGLISGAAYGIYTVLANADLPWPEIELGDGRMVLLDQSGYAKHRRASDREDRRKVFESFWGLWRQYERTAGVALYSQLKADVFYANARKYPNTLARSLSPENIPESVYRTLVAEANRGLPVLHRSFRLRARMLGVDDLRYHDIYPSLVKLDRDFPIEEARRLVVESVAPLGAGYQSRLADGLAGRWMHTFPRAGKKSGGYMNGSAYDAHPYVLMNYQGEFDSVGTLAHEWGHAMHSVLTNETQPFVYADYSIFVAEIASILNEFLLHEHLVSSVANDKERLYFLGMSLEQMRGTFFRQTMFAEFELATHEAAEKGDALSGERFTRMYGELLRRYHGHDEGVLIVDDLYTVEWAYIPHFYYNYYVYQYATSIAAAAAFAERILAGEAGAAESFLDLLRAGGSDHPYELVKKAGLDVASPEPYRALLKRMDRTIDEIEKIMESVGSGTSKY